MVGRALVVVCFLAPWSLAASAQTPVAGPLVVFNAGSLAKPFSDLLRAFKTRYPEVTAAQENSGSLEAARKMTDLGKTPDIIAVADYGIIPKLLIPKHANWYATFAMSSMVLAYTEQSLGAGEISAQNWWRILQRSNVRWGHSDPVLDPAGYRSLMVFQLAEHFYKQPGLAKRLDAARPSRYIRPKSADLIALVQVGELDYAWEYEAVAKMHNLHYLELPGEINLGDPRFTENYASASVRLPGASRAGADSVEFRGEPIVYALTIPTAAPHPRVAIAFAHFVHSPEGKAILSANGFTVPEKPIIAGPGKPPPGLF